MIDYRPDTLHQKVWENLANSIKHAPLPKKLGPIYDRNVLIEQEDDRMLRIYSGNAHRMSRTVSRSTPGLDRLIDEYGNRGIMLDSKMVAEAAKKLGKTPAGLRFEGDSMYVSYDNLSFPLDWQPRETEQASYPNVSDIVSDAETRFKSTQESDAAITVKWGALARALDISRRMSRKQSTSDRSSCVHIHATGDKLAMMLLSNAGEHGSLDTLQYLEAESTLGLPDGTRTSDMDYYTAWNMKVMLDMLPIFTSWSELTFHLSYRKPNLVTSDCDEHISVVFMEANADTENHVYKRWINMAADKNAE